MDSVEADKKLPGVEPKLCVVGLEAAAGRRVQTGAVNKKKKRDCDRSL